MDIKVGRELDLIVAGKVFGIKKIHYAEYDTEQEYPEYIPSGKPWRTHQIDAKPLPHFSTDPTGSHNVKLKMAETYHWVIRSPFRIGLKWFAGLTPLGTTGWNGKPDFNASGDTEMEAVCRVALMALEKSK